MGWKALERVELQGGVRLVHALQQGFGEQVPHCHGACERLVSMRHCQWCRCFSGGQAGLQELQNTAARLELGLGLRAGQDGGRTQPQHSQGHGPGWSWGSKQTVW